MTTYKNKAYKKRNYEMTNIVFAVALTDNAKIDNDNFVECDAIELENSNCTPLWIENDIRYYGYL